MAGRRLPMFPLGTVLFPHAVIPLHVFEAQVSRPHAALSRCGSSLWRGVDRAWLRGRRWRPAGWRGYAGRDHPSGRAARWAVGPGGDRRGTGGASTSGCRTTLIRSPWSAPILADESGSGRGGACRRPSSRRSASRRLSASGGHGPCSPNMAGRRPFRPSCRWTAGAAWRWPRGSSARRRLSAPTTPRNSSPRAAWRARLTRLVQFMEELELDLERMLAAE